jgi:hypothetical protein
MSDSANRRDWTEAQKASAEADLLARKVAHLERNLSALREAADGLWYCLRHLRRVDASEIAEAVDDYTEARDQSETPFDPNK